MDEILQDKRFAHVVRDPRFHRMARDQRKVQIDKRFKNMFKDKRFKLKYSVDKRGRPVKLTTNENLKKYYELDEDSSEDDNDSDEEDEGVSDDQTPVLDDGSESEDEEDSDSDDISGEELEEKTKKSKIIHTQMKDPRFKVSEMKTLKSKHDKMNKQKDLEVKSEEVSVTNKKTKFHMSDRMDKDKVTVKTKSKSKQKLGRQVPDIASSSSDSEYEDAGDDGNDDKIKDEEDSDVGDKDDSDDKDDEDSEDDDDEFDSVKQGEDAVDLARGEGNLDSSSSSEEDDEIEDVIGSGPKTEFDHRWGELDEEAEEMSEATSRLAVCNMDWDRIKAKDIYVLLNSFKPTKGLIKSVKVYKSEFGKARMEEEKEQGPRELKELKEERAGSDGEMEDNIGTKYHTEKLRQYQLNRLKYFYAVVECDTMETADEIYKECDGLEYETSSTKMDLRFIPDDMEFDDEPESLCNTVPPGYKPSMFINTALSQSKVELTWDETDRERVQLTAQQFTSKAKDLKEDDLQAYLASSSDEEGHDYGALVDQSDDDDEGGNAEESEDKHINKYKMLLQEIDKGEKEKKQNDVQMEITWEPGLKEATEGILKKKEQKGLTPWEEYLERKKEKKRKKREEKKKKKADDRLDSDQEVEQDVTISTAAAEVEEGGQAFSDDELPSGVDFDDPFFSELKSDKKIEKDKKKKKKKKKESETAVENNSSEKAALSLLLMDEDDNREHFNLKNLVQDDEQKKKKKKKKMRKHDEDEEEDISSQVDNFKMNVKDPRFAAMYESHLFNLDPSAPEFKKTKGTEAIIEEKLKRRKNSEKKGLSSTTGKETSGGSKRKIEEDSTNIKMKDDSLASLVNSVKTKTKNFQNKKIKR